MYNTIPSIPITYTPITGYKLMSDYVPYYTLYRNTTPSPFQQWLSVLPGSVASIAGLASLFIPGMQNIVNPAAIRIPTSAYDMLAQLREQHMNQYMTSAFMDAMKADRDELSKYIAKYWTGGKETRLTRFLGTAGAWAAALAGIDFIPGGSHLRAAMMAHDVAKTYIAPERFLTGVPISEIRRLQQQIYRELKSEYITGNFTLSAGLDRQTLALLTKELSARGMFGGAYVGGKLDTTRILNTIRDWAGVFKSLSDVTGSKDFKDLFRSLQELTAGEFTTMAPQQLQRHVERMGWISTITGIRTSFMQNFVSAINRTYQPYGFGRLGLILGPEALLGASMMRMRGLGGALVSPVQLAGMAVEQAANILINPQTFANKYNRLAAYAHGLGLKELQPEIQKMLETDDIDEKKFFYNDILSTIQQRTGLSRDEIMGEIAQMDPKLVAMMLESEVGNKTMKRIIRDRALRYLPASLRRDFKVINDMQDMNKQFQVYQAISGAKDFNDLQERLAKLNLSQGVIRAAGHLFRGIRTSRYSEQIASLISLYGQGRAEYLLERHGRIFEAMKEVHKRYQIRESPIAVLSNLLNLAASGDFKNLYLRMAGYTGVDQVKDELENVIDNMDLDENEKKRLKSQIGSVIGDIIATSGSETNKRDMEQLIDMINRMNKGEDVDSAEFQRLYKRVAPRIENVKKILQMIKKPEYLELLSKPERLASLIKLYYSTHGLEFKPEEWGIGEGGKIDRTKLLSEFFRRGKLLMPFVEEFLKTPAEKASAVSKAGKAEGKFPEEVKISGTLTLNEGGSKGQIEGKMIIGK